MTFYIKTHTADFSVIFSSNNFPQLILSILDFFKKEIIENYIFKDNNFIIEKKNYFSENISFSIVDFLNDIIFFLEQGIILEKIEVINFNEKGFSLKLFLKKCKLLNLKVELKAATYHNIKFIRLNDKPIKFEVIFDI